MDGVESAPSSPALTAVARLSFLVGAVALMLGIADAHRTTRLLQTGVRARGAVVNSQECDYDESTRGSRDVIEFESVSGRRVQIVGVCSSRFSSVGDTRMVYYRPEAPERAEVGPPSLLWVRPILVSALGAMLLAIGVRVAFAARRARREARSQLHRSR